MTTLETAIRQIDRESRELLQQTFDIVNENFAKLFPVLFGGGQAKLVLTGEEILDSGVQVIAHPPGKRNTSIHLLSGGEKALTAISLVFALFQLNPAPFCLLDEVDAPLDDSNTAPLLQDGAGHVRRDRSSCSSRTTRSRWKWRTSWSASRCPTRASRASSRSTSPKRSSSPPRKPELADLSVMFDQSGSIHAWRALAMSSLQLGLIIAGFAAGDRRHRLQRLAGAAPEA